MYTYIYILSLRWSLWWGMLYIYILPFWWSLWWWGMDVAMDDRWWCSYSYVFLEDGLWLKDLVRSTCLYHECLIEITTKSVACHPGIHFSFGSFLIESEAHKEWVKIQDHHERLLKDHVENPRSYQGHILGKKNPVTFSGHRWLGCCHSEAFSANGTSLRSHKAKLWGENPWLGEVQHTMGSNIRPSSQSAKITSWTPWTSGM